MTQIDWDDSETAESLDIAIIGMSGRFPGAGNLQEFWHNLRDGVESIRFFTDEEMRAFGVDATSLSDTTFIKAGAILNGVDQFDASFFGYPPREAALLDPQHRIFLECAWEALENAGYNSETFEGAVGVYAGMSLSTYLLYNLLGNPRCSTAEDHFQVMLGSDKDFLSTRVSYHMNLRGPSLDVQTGCSTSLVAVSLACQSLLTYQCDMAMAGGISIQVPQRTGYFYQEGGLNSPDGHCRAFDARAEGTIFGSGAGVVILKRLTDAMVAGDQILAIIKGVAINNDGSHKIGYTAPSVDGQAQVITAAQTLAGVEAESISYIETHGTGTTLGDPIEVAALTKAFRAATNARQFCAIGSVKTNLGHLDAAAGIAGFIKTVLAIRHKQLPPSLHFKEANPKIDFSSSPFYVNHTLSDWKKNGTPLRAGVSSFGIGGTNAHAILEEAPSVEPSGASRPWQLLLLSAKTSAALESATANLLNHLKQQAEINLADVAYTLQVGRKSFDYRRMLVCSDLQDGVKALESEPQRMFTGYQQAGERPVAFMFPGGGAQYVNMGFDLYQTEAVFRQAVDTCCELLKPRLGFDLRNFLYPGTDPSPELVNQMKRTLIGLPALFVIEYATAKLWMSWGIRPQAMIGHSLGEYAAACLAGVFSLEDALSLVVLRGKLFEQLPRGAMLSIPLPEEQVRQHINGKLSVAAINAPSQCIVSGSIEAIEEVTAWLTDKEIEFRQIQIDVAAHSDMVTPILEPLARLLETLHLEEPRIPYVSNVTAKWIAPGEATNPGYWTRHLRQTVRFGEGIKALLEEPEYVVLEVGPGQTLCTLAKMQSGVERARTVFASMRHPYERQSDVAFILSSLGKLALAGVEIDWIAFHAAERRHRVALPTYPFEHRRYWIEPQKDGRTRQSTVGKKPDIADWFYVPSWKRSVRPKPFEAGNPADDPQSWLVFMDDYGLGEALVTRLAAQSQRVIQVTKAERFKQNAETLYALNPARKEDYFALLKHLHACNQMPERIVHLWSLTAEEQELSEAQFFKQMQQDGFYSLVFLAQSLTEENLTSPAQLWVVSNQLQQVESSDVVYAEKATLLSPCKIVPQEAEHITCRYIDVMLTSKSQRHIETLCGQLMAEMNVQSPDPIIAYRGQHRWIQIFEPAKLESGASSVTPLRQRGVYLITGGLGGIGLLLAEYLAQQVQARLVLTSRSAFPPRDEWERWLSHHDDADHVSRKIRRLLAIEDSGTEVLVLSADAANAAQMRSVIEVARNQFGQIYGILHAAGVAGEQTVQLLPDVEPAQCERQFQAKVYGLYVLEEVLKDEEFAFCLLFSSNVSVLGGLGSLSYTAANLFMDAFATVRNQADGKRWISVNWDGWLLTDESRLRASYQTSIDQYAMTPEESTEAFMRLVTLATVPQVVASTGDLSARMEMWLALRNQAASDSSEGATPGEPHPRPALGTAYVPPSNKNEEVIARVWQDLLGIEELGIHDNFFDLGGNSLLALKIISQLKKEMQIDIPVVSLFEGPTVQALAQVISQLGTKQLADDESRFRGERRRQGRRGHHREAVLEERNR
jgi:acyl transferase domain-containing protein